MLRLTAFALVSATLVVASLTAVGCLAPCSCPSGGGSAIVMLKAAQSSPIASLTTAAPCTAMDGGSGHIVVTTSEPGTCRVRVVLMSGDGYSFDVVFRAISSSCCGNLVGDHTVSVPEPFDAGAGG